MDCMKKKLTKIQERDLAALAALPDEQIDTSDIPEIKSLTGGIRGRFGRPRPQIRTGTRSLQSPKVPPP
jgi:hypothetical protein